MNLLLFLLLLLLISSFVSAHVHAKDKPNNWAPSFFLHSGGIECFTAADYIHENYDKYLILNLRGVPDSATEHHFILFLDNLRKYLGYGKAGNQQQFLDTCMSTTSKMSFAIKHSTADGLALTIETKSFIQTIGRDSFFLSRMTYSDEQIGAFGDPFIQLEVELIAKLFPAVETKGKPVAAAIVTSARKKNNHHKKKKPRHNHDRKARKNRKKLKHLRKGIQKKGQKEARRIKRSGQKEKDSRFAKTVKFFHDPNETEVRLKMKGMYKVQVESRARTVRAEEFFNQCLAYVYGLEILKVSRKKSMHLLQHCISFLFQTIRAQRVEGPDLEVSVYFLPFYHGAFGEYTQHLPQHKVNEAKIPLEVMKEIWGDTFGVYWSFDSWGKTNFIDWETTKLVDVESVLFAQPVLNVVGTALKEAKRIEKHATAHQSTPKSCSSNAYVWYYREGADDEECCCAAFCDNVRRNVAAHILGKKECCHLCNEKRCSFKDTKLSHAAVLEVVPYGYQQRYAISVII